MSISPTGYGLNIVISCEYLRHHSWMAFASWYSIFKNLPDAKVQILCDRTGLPEVLFNWTNKCKVPIYHVNKSDLEVENSFNITPDVMAVSTYEPEMLGPGPARSDENFTFVSYLDGCGKFVFSEWIDSIRNPFGVTNNLYSNDLKLNEYRILKLWEKCNKTYNATV